MWESRSFISDREKLCTRTFCFDCEGTARQKFVSPRHKGLTSITVGKSCNVCRRSVENFRNGVGNNADWLSTTTRQRTMLHQCSNIWPLKEFQWCTTLHTCLIWPITIFSCSREWNYNCEIAVSIMSLKFKKNRWMFFSRFPKVGYNGPSSSDRETRSVA
jgi:hypothetical protein